MCFLFVSQFGCGFSMCFLFVSQFGCGTGSAGVFGVFLSLGRGTGSAGGIGLFLKWGVVLVRLVFLVCFGSGAWYWFGLCFLFVSQFGRGTGSAGVFFCFSIGAGYWFGW